MATSAQSTRVNIVRRAGDGGGVWELSAEQAADGRVSPGGEAARSGRAGSVRYGGSADLGIAHLPIRGVRVDHDEVGAGNPDLRPETSWRIELGGDWRFAEEGAMNLTLYRWAIEDALDIVPRGPPDDRLDAPGNIGAATAYGARVSLALPLPWDAELRLDGFAQRSEATDPLTGEERSLSEFEESALTIGFRQDIAPFAWGLDYEREAEAPAFRFDRIERERDAEELTLWFETTALADVKLRAWGSNLSDDTEERRRQLFDPDRLGGFDGSDRRAHAAGASSWRFSATPVRAPRRSPTMARA